MEHLTLRTETDTATPRRSIPIYFIHILQAPLCNRSGCWCQVNQVSIAHLLTAINNKELILHEAVSFTASKTE